MKTKMVTALCAAAFLLLFVSGNSQIVAIENFEGFSSTIDLQNTLNSTPRCTMPFGGVALLETGAGDGALGTNKWCETPNCSDGSALQESLPLFFNLSTPILPGEYVEVNFWIRSFPGSSLDHKYFVNLTDFGPCPGEKFYSYCMVQPGHNLVFLGGQSGNFAPWTEVSICYQNTSSNILDHLVIVGYTPAFGCFTRPEIDEIVVTRYSPDFANSIAFCNGTDFQIDVVANGFPAGTSNYFYFYDADASGSTSGGNGLLGIGNGNSFTFNFDAADASLGHIMVQQWVETCAGWASEEHVVEVEAINNDPAFDINITPGPGYYIYAPFSTGNTAQATSEVWEIIETDFAGNIVSGGFYDQQVNPAAPPFWKKRRQKCFLFKHHIYVPCVGLLSEEHWVCNDNVIFKSEENGMEELEQALEVELYPNPVQEELHLDFNRLTTGHYEVIDLQGRVLEVGILEGKANKLRVVNLGAGMYLIRMISEGETIVKRFLKQ